MVRTIVPCKECHEYPCTCVNHIWKDGLYRVTYKGITAGFIIRNGVVVECAPILKKKIKFWKTIAKWISE